MFFDKNIKTKIDLVVVSIIYLFVIWYSYLGKWSHLTSWQRFLSDKLKPPTEVQNMKSVWKCFQEETPTRRIFKDQSIADDTCRHVSLWLSWGSRRSMCKILMPLRRTSNDKHWSNSDHSKHWRMKRWSPGYFLLSGFGGGGGKKMCFLPKSTISLNSNPWKESGFWYQDDAKEEAREENMIHGLVWCFPNYIRFHIPLFKAYSPDV